MENENPPCPGVHLNTCPVLEVLLGCIILLALNSRIEVLNEDLGSLLNGFPQSKSIEHIYRLGYLLVYTYTVYTIILYIDQV